MKQLVISVVIAMVSFAANAAEINVMISGGMAAAYRDLVPAFEQATKIKVNTTAGASMGTAPTSIPSRLARGEPADVLILVSYSLDEFIAQGKAVQASRVDLGRSLVAMAVRAGQPKPDISTVDALRRALLGAKSIAYSASASGVYVSTELFQKLGIADQVAGKGRKVLGEPVGTVVARGEAEIGFQQVSELLPIAGIDYVGPIPAEVQKVTVFSAGIASAARNPEGGRALIRFLASPEAAPVIAKSGVEPAGTGR
jgi:molybdate transport system substrate-binding protein